MPDTTCEDYNDPKADIVLRSKTNVLFRIHSYYLKAHSSVFRDMLELPNFASEPDTHHITVDASESNIALTSTTDTDTPVDVDAPTAAIHDLLDLLTKDMVRELRTQKDCQALLSLCDAFDFHVVVHRIIPLLNDYAAQYPWAAFCLADRYNNLDLARKAIKNMGAGSNPWQGRLVLRDIDAAMGRAVSPEYLLGLMRALSLSSLQGHYDKLAAAFEPAS